MSKNYTKPKAIKAYKVFTYEWKCRDFQFELGKTFKHKGAVEICASGFHACLQVADCFSYYSFDSKNKVAEVLLWGEVDEKGDDSKVCSNNIQIVRELEWQEVLVLANTGKDCTGLKNSGDGNSGDGNSGNRNSGNRNSGDWNSGDWNSGNRNSGNRNSGDGNSGDGNSGNRNSGNRNSGDWNSGDWNSGNRNSGNRNSGDGNSGNRNSGNRNSGNRNSGDWNSGDWNSGNRNSGNRNSGDGNSGNRNSGNRNSGDWNSGDWNSGNRNSGDWNSGDGNKRFFCSENQNVLIFNKPTDLPIDEIYSRMPSFWSYSTCVWVSASAMTDEEKTANPHYETTEGYLKQFTYQEMCAAGWKQDDDENKLKFFRLPNFDLEVFKKITSIDASADYKRLVK